MDANELDGRLSQMKTRWSLLFQAHQGLGDGTIGAQKQLLLRYYGAAYRYLLGTVRDAAVAEELTQEFAVRFLRGDFRRAAPERGHFRDFLKVALRHLVIDHWRRLGKAPQPLGQDQAADASPAFGDALDAPFLEKWREELLAHAWKGLADLESTAGPPYHTVLRWKTETPSLPAMELAQRLSEATGKTVTETGLRQILHRAREKFADLLLEEVARSLGTTDTEKLEQELIELGLREYCVTALARRRAGT